MAEGVLPGTPALAAEVVHALSRAGATVATAESLTGGLLGAALTSVPGASAVYRGGVVAYATDLKHRLLGVDAGLLAERGAVDPVVAEAMARGAQTRLGADYGLATTGVAGPDPQDGHRVGTVWLGVAGAGGVVHLGASLPVAGSDVGADGQPGREDVRAHTVARALAALLAAVAREAAGRSGR